MYSFILNKYLTMTINKLSIIIDFDQFKDIDTFLRYTFLKINSYILSNSTGKHEIWSIDFYDNIIYYNKLEVISMPTRCLEQLLYEELTKFYYYLLDKNEEDWEENILIKENCVKPYFIDIEIYSTSCK